MPWLTQIQRLLKDIFAYKNKLFNPKSKSSKAKEITSMINVQLFLYDGKKEPIGHAHYKLTSVTGSTFNGELDANGKATISQVPAGPYKVNFSSFNAAGTDSQYVEQLKQQLQQQRVKLKFMLDQIAKKIAASDPNPQLELQHTSMRQKIFNLIATTGESGYYIVRDVGKKNGETSPEIIYNKSDLTNHMMDISIGEEESSTETVKRETIQVAPEDTHTFWWLMRDKESWSIIEDFVQQYWQALCTQAKKNQIQYSSFMLSIVLITKKAVLPGSVVADHEVVQVSTELKKTAEIIHQIDVTLEKIGQNEKLESIRLREIDLFPATPPLLSKPELEAAFKDGASMLLTEQVYEDYFLDKNILGGPNGLVVTTKASMDELLARVHSKSSSQD